VKILEYRNRGVISPIWAYGKWTQNIEKCIGQYLIQHIKILEIKSCQEFDVGWEWNVHNQKTMSSKC
jgi:hypothetical protein